VVGVVWAFGGCALGSAGASFPMSSCRGAALSNVLCSATQTAAGNSPNYVTLGKYSQHLGPF
jgi:hypothetical protein